MIKCAVGQDSHRFEDDGQNKPLILGGVEIKGHVGLRGNSDADVVLHALTNAVSGISGKNILGRISDEMCTAGIKDSRRYLEKALITLGKFRLIHVSISVECKTPKLSGFIDSIKCSVAGIIDTDPGNIGFTATSGEGLTEFGRGKGIQAFVIVTASDSSEL